MAIQPVSLAQYIREGVIAAINALNQVIDFVNAHKKSYTAYSTLGTIAGNKCEDFTITLPSGMFSSAPQIVANLYSSSTNAAFGSLNVSIMNVSATQFTARVYNASSTSFTPGLIYYARERG